MSSRALTFALVLLAVGASAARATDLADARALTDEARGMYEAGELSGATGKLEKALLLAPGHVPAEQLLAVTYHAQNDVARAIEHYWAVQRASLLALLDDAGPDATRRRELIVECEGLLVLLTNQERAQRELPLCLPDARLATVARGHSEEMRDLKFFAHESPTPARRTIALRFKEVFGDLISYGIAENIARRYGQGVYSLSPESVHKSHEDWMASTGHRANILRRELTHVGMGIAVNSNGDYWATEFFARF